MYLCGMETTGDRLRAYREKAGHQPEGLADQIGITPNWFEDLENNEGELEETLDLDQIRKLALLLNVGMAQLLTGSPVPPGTAPMSFKDLARHVRRRLETEPGLESLEERTGWDLADYLKRPDTEGWGQRIQFYKDVCGALGVDWVGILAYGEALPE